MPKKWIKIVIEIIFILLGLGFLSLAVFARQFHLGANDRWGANRIVVALIGAFFLLLAVLLVLSPALTSMFRLSFFQKISNLLASPLRWLFRPIETRQRNSVKGGTGWAVSGAAIAIFVALWYISSGRLVNWEPSTTYFDRQANAFLSGQIALLEKPPAKLATLANPYLNENRAGVGGYIWDASYYKGKYYYYWGPMPSLMATMVKVFYPSLVVQDEYLIFFSIAGLAIVLAALFHHLRNRYFPMLPSWVVMGMILLGVLNMPVFWLVNYPHVHEGSIAMGELFLILGFYTVVRGMESQKHRVPWLAATGLLWGAAIASRINLVLGIGWMVTLVCLFFFFRLRNWRLAGGALLALTVPLLAWGSGLAWYNYARFGNILETGHRYQLTGAALPADYKNVTSISYILPNLYNMLTRPMEVHWREFPIFFTPHIKSGMWPRILFFPTSPYYFFDEPITGIFISIPTIYLLLAILTVPVQKWLFKIAPEPVPARSSGDQPIPSWLGWMVGGALLWNLAFLATFIYSAMRYLADITPLLTILIIICLGLTAQSLRPRARIWWLILVLLAISLVISILFSLLANFQNMDYIFMNNNPHLYRAIAHFITNK